MTDWKQETENLRQQGSSWTEIAEAMQCQFPELNRQQVLERVRGHIRRTNKTIKAVGKNKIILVIGDTHFPFEHPNYLEFLKQTAKEYKVTDIVHIGDMCDNSAISRHQTETCAMDATTEYQKALECVQRYAKVFPKLKYVLGNHSLIPLRQCATMGIPKEFIKGTSELWNFPQEWEVAERYIIDNVLYEHGIGYGGKNGALDKANNSMMSCVIGHSHAFGGCQYKSNSEKLIFGLNAGAGVDISAYAFNYGKFSKNRETLGCGIVLNQSKAIFVPMGLEFFRN